MNTEESSFKEKLDQNHVFPTLYMFKFIVPENKVEEVKNIFPKNELSLKSSSGGKYVSATVNIMVSSSEQVIGIYKDAKKIKGIISL